MGKCKIFYGFGSGNFMENDINDFLKNNSIDIISVTQSSASVMNELKTCLTIVYEEKYLPQDTGPK